MPEPERPDTHLGHLSDPDDMPAKVEGVKARQPRTRGAGPISGWSRLGEGDGYLSRRIRERRAEGVDIDNKIASAFYEGFHDLPAGSFNAREFLTGREGREAHERYQRVLRGQTVDKVIVDEVIVERTEEPAKPMLELLAENPPHPSETGAGP